MLPAIKLISVCTPSKQSARNSNVISSSPCVPTSTTSVSVRRSHQTEFNQQPVSPSDARFSDNSKSNAIERQVWRRQRKLQQFMANPRVAGTTKPIPAIVICGQLTKNQAARDRKAGNLNHGSRSHHVGLPVALHAQWCGRPINLSRSAKNSG